MPQPETMDITSEKVKHAQLERLPKRPYRNRQRGVRTRVRTRSANFTNTTGNKLSRGYLLESQPVLHNVKYFTSQCLGVRVDLCGTYYLLVKQAKGMGTRRIPFYFSNLLSTSFCIMGGNIPKPCITA